MTTPVYCTVQDVADFLRVDITDTTTPNKAQVVKLINRKEDEIDRRTGHAWREATATTEVHDLPIIYEFGWGTPIFLRHRNIRTGTSGELLSGSGDKLEVFSGASDGVGSGAAAYTDITDTPTGVYELEPEYGRLYMRGFIFTVMRKNRIRVTYRYGDETVPGDIEEACVKLVAMELMSTSFRADILPVGGTTGWDWKDSIHTWKKDVDKIIHDRQEIITIA
ncbi:MAG: hypothetical protein H8D23_05185 [Candidatus Brocadiales bacterium]|nr:hypothetical protein [Candidatus Brocadiales bacterium]